MEETSKSTFQEAISAAKKGDRGKARELLIRLVRSDPKNPEYWVWLSSVADTKKDKIACLEKALELDPQNKAAHKGLVILGARAPQAYEVEAAAETSRKLAEEVKAPGRLGQFVRKNWLLVTAGAAVPLVILGSFIFMVTRPSAPAPTLPPPSPTVTETPIVPTNTPAPVELLIVRTPIPMEYAETPLTAFVAQTPTPTPLIGIADKSPYEAYTGARSAFLRAEYEAALGLIIQVLQLDPNSVDGHYLQAEILRMLARPKKARSEYERVIELEPEFAPAHLGRARVRLMIDPDTLPEGFDRAIELDPDLTPAYVEKAEFFASKGQWGDALGTLQLAIERGLESPILYVRRSNAQRNLGAYAEALESAKTGSGADPSLVEGYLALGAAYIELEQFETALWPLQTYAVYQPDDGRAWLYLGRGHYGIGERELGIELLTQAINRDPALREAYYHRGIYRLEMGDYQAAIDDFLQARRSGIDNFVVNMGIAEAKYLLEQYDEAFENADLALAKAVAPGEKSEALTLMAMIYENTEPIAIEEAIATWEEVMTVEGINAETLALAQSHLRLLYDLLPTPTPTPTPLANKIGGAGIRAI